MNARRLNSRKFMLSMALGAVVWGVWALPAPSDATPVDASEVAAQSVVGAPESKGRMEPLPDELDGVGITEHIGDILPLEAAFTDDDGRSVILGDYFDGTRPVLLTLNYSSCPMLCSLQLNGLLNGMRELDWTIGDEFEVVTVSIDPTESTRLAKLTKQKYLNDYGRPGAGDGWHFLTGDPASIRATTSAIGFGYRLVEGTGEYAHAAATFVVMPNGTISRYLYGVQYEPKTLRLSMVEAADGKVGSTVDKILLFCFHYDATKGKYGPAVMNIMRMGGTITMLALGILVTHYLRRDKRRPEVA